MAWLDSLHVTTLTPNTDTDGLRNSDNTKQVHAAAAVAAPPPSIQPMLSMNEPCSHCPQISPPTTAVGIELRLSQPTRVDSGGGSSHSLNGYRGSATEKGLSVAAGRGPSFRALRFSCSLRFATGDLECQGTDDARWWRLGWWEEDGGWGEGGGEGER